MEFQGRKTGIWVYAGSLLCIIAAFAAAFAGDKLLATKTISYEIANHAAQDDNTTFDINMSVSKQWLDNELHPDTPVGAQYDGVITNYIKEPFQNWVIELEVPEDAVLDSSWNGNYVLKDGKLQITPVEYNEFITSDKQETFGFVMYSKELIDFKHSLLSGRRQPQYFQSPLFIVLLAITGIWLIAFISHIFIRIRTAKYEKKQKEDSRIIMQSMSTFANMIDAKDPYTKGHSTRVAIYASEIARRMKLSKEEIDTIFYVGLLHDCGKIGIPDSVLKKPEKLTIEEWHLIQSHTTLGSNVLINFTAIKGIRDGALYHHERFDGRGYPSGLRGEEIPLYARIICVADSYDAMSSNRCYRAQIEKQIILKELNNNSGTQFDPAIVKHMIDMINEGFVTTVQEKTQIFSVNHA